jgi:hypothetical protein
VGDAFADAFAAQMSRDRRRVKAYDLRRCRRHRTKEACERLFGLHWGES